MLPHQSEYLQGQLYIPVMYIIEIYSGSTSGRVLDETVCRQMQTN